jgi:hypothetical protein
MAIFEIAIASRDKARIAPTGVDALNKLELSAQVQMKVLWLIDGASYQRGGGSRNNMVN